MDTFIDHLEIEGGKRVTLPEAIAAQRPGQPLSRCFYTDPTIFQRDLQRMVLRHWHCAGHISMVGQPGDFFVIEIGAESVIITRGQDGGIRGLLNVCRHRGSRVCIERAGTARGGFTCPYHAWNYGTDGELRAARHLPAEFAKTDYGLKQVHLRVIEGLIFITFAEQPLGLTHVEAALRSSMRAYGWADAKVAHRETYSVTGNWKLVMENYWECYHCSPAHQEFSRAHAMARHLYPDPALMAQIFARATAMGVEITEMDHLAPHALPGEETADSFRSPLVAGFVSGSEDGGPVAPLMGQFTDYDGGITFSDIGPTSNFLAYADHGVIYRFMPRAVDRTEMEVIWLVRGDAKEGVDYDLDRLTWLWRVTSIADKRIIELNQQGVNSAYYEPGPYTPMETWSRRFVDWYLREIA
jgi:Rieske 2Fe-2S family protein